MNKDLKLGNMTIKAEGLMPDGTVSPTTKLHIKEIKQGEPHVPKIEPSQPIHCTHCGCVFLVLDGKLHHCPECASWDYFVRYEF